ncbi:MAG: DUF1697 domain-containing protein [Planctomycetota bacterium]|nr:DUF1697 domain-containing protein [Planctomycetota bacterium]
MSTWIAFFRGINVGGKNSLPMKDLVRELEALDLRDVRTYIQSGNAVFESPKKVPATLGARIASRIEKRHGFKPQVLILSAGALEKAIRSNPFPEAASEPKSLHFCFLASLPRSPDIDALTAAQTRTERFRLIGQVLYLHTPDGIGRSKLAATVEKALGVTVTARNWRTVDSLREMLSSQ